MTDGSKTLYPPQLVAWGIISSEEILKNVRGGGEVGLTINKFSALIFNAYIMSDNVEGGGDNTP